MSIVEPVKRSNFGRVSSQGQGPIQRLEEQELNNSGRHNQNHNPHHSQGSSRSSIISSDSNQERPFPGNISGSPLTGMDLLSTLSHPELVQRVKKLEADLLKLASDHNHMIREANHHIQVQGSEISNLKGTITRLEEDNAELRDLCCFLDDDRQKGRKLAREWQRFGRYTATVMRQEVAAYQSKLRDLDTRQQRLISDNMELKELCLYLDEERNQNFCTQCGAVFRRDDGDGSSLGTNGGLEEYGHGPNGGGGGGHPLILNYSNSTNHNNNNEGDNMDSIPGTLADMRDETTRGILGSQIVEYVRRLETRVNELEKQETITCPESVLNALQVLQVCQGLEDHDIGDQEKALVRQMCNVVWKKLEDNPKLL